MGKHGLTVLLLIAALPVEGSSEERPVTAHWVDVTHELQAARGPVTKRVENEFAAVSVAIRWADATDRLEPGAIGVVLLPEPPGPPYVPPRALGAAAENEETRVVYIYFNRVLRAAGLSSAVRSLSTEEEVVFWRALSRVISHEMVHALVPRVRHAESGIMSAHLTPLMLQRAALGFDAETKCQIQRALVSTESCRVFAAQRNQPIQ